MLYMLLDRVQRKGLADERLDARDAFGFFDSIGVDRSRKYNHVPLDLPIILTAQFLDEIYAAAIDQKKINENQLRKINPVLVQAR